MRALLVEGIFHWGFSVRIITESAGAQYYLYPPPSTLIGALAYGINILKDFPECTISNSGKQRTSRKELKIMSSAVLLHDIVKWVAFAFSDELSVGKRSAAIGYADFIRSFRLLYQRGARHVWEQSDMWYGVNAHGKVYACGTGFKILYLLDENRTARLGINEQKLLMAAYSIVRLGAHESLVSINNVQITDKVEVLTADHVKIPFETEYYFPSRLAEVERKESTLLPKLDKRLWEFRPENPVGIHDHEEYYVPPAFGLAFRTGKICINKLAKDSMLVIAHFANNRVEKILVPAEVIK
jgi:CRISPR-associated protein Cas5a/b/c